MFRLIVDLVDKGMDFLEEVLNLTETDYSFDEGGRLVVDDLDKALAALQGFKVTVV